jgi:hypothetical protein
LASNVYLTGAPSQLWNSAYSDTIFVFDFVEYVVTNIQEQIVSSVGTGYAQITINENWDINPVKNEYVYINAGAYYGIHRVLSSSNNTIVINVNYTTSLPANDIVIIKHLRLPQFNLYKGFKNDEQFIDILFYEKVATFTYSFNKNYQIEINIKGLIQKIFQIEPPSLINDFDYSVFNAVRLTWDGEETIYYLILNTSIPTNELNSKYVSGGIPLTNINEPIIWGCGNTFMTIFDSGYPKLNIYNGITQVTAGFNNAFQTNQFSQGFDIT